MDEWDDRALSKVLYESDGGNTYPIHEYKDIYSVLDAEEEEEEEGEKKDEGDREEKEDSEKDAEEEEQDVFLTLDDDGIPLSATSTVDTDTTMGNESSSQPTTILIVKFYAHWCPHCIHYKPTYISIANQILRRSMNIPSDNIHFMAVSCPLNPRICQTYEVDGYPTVMGWKFGGENEGLKLGEDGYYYGIANTILDRGVVLNPTPEDDEAEMMEMTADTIASMLEFDLAMDVDGMNQDVEGEEEELTEEEALQREKWQVQRGVDAANMKSSWIEYGYRSHEALRTSWGWKRSLDVSSTEEQLELELLNERFHDAAASFAYIIKNGIAYNHPKRRKQDTREERSSLDGTKASALYDFLSLIDWATPPEWQGMNDLVRDLLHDFDSTFSSRTSTNKVVDEHLDGTRKSMNDGNDDIQWGHIDPKSAAKLHQKDTMKQRSSLGLDAPRHYRPTLTKRDKRLQNSQWSDACTHAQPIHTPQANTRNQQGLIVGSNSEHRSTGFTCGLWSLLHITSIGASKPRRIIDGYQKGYIVTPQYVARSVNSFLESFFNCDVCKRNFNKMYNSCGLDHCHRLSGSVEVSILQDSVVEGQHDEYDGNENNDASKELALWLWEVHNAVNARLMKESAERDKRTVTIAEVKASRFPSTRMCPKCWLDEDMETFDRNEVFQFLHDFYWPSKGPSGIASKRNVDSYENRRYTMTEMILILLCVVFIRNMRLKRKKSDTKAL